MTAKSTAAH